jgi:two-component system NtrC family sensor kinase
VNLLSIPVILSTRFRLIASFLGVSLLVGGLSLIVGGRLIYRAVVGEAQARVGQDLNSAREIYDDRIRSALLGVSLVAGGNDMRAAVRGRQIPFLTDRLLELVAEVGLDFAGVVAADGTVLLRTGSADRTLVNPAASLALRRAAPVSGMVVLDRPALAAEGPTLAERARIALLPTPRAAPRADTEETEGMTIAAAVPVVSGDTLAGVVYGGVLLNRNYEIVDRIRETVFRQETYGGTLIGSATIFFRDLRIATNVLSPSGERAIGTRVSAEVKEKVLDAGGLWTDRAFVVKDWYVTAYEPLEDVFGQRVGMLYVGVLEAKYADLRTRTMAVFAVITLGGMLAAIALGSLLGYRLLRPIQQLIAASQRVSAGDMTAEIAPLSRSEIGILQKTFQEMLVSLRERDRRHEAEKETQLLQSEKQASVGRLAAGIAHEINNPLTGVLTFTHMLLRRPDIDEQARRDLQTIAQSTDRVRTIVKGLLDFSRQTRIEAAPADINAIVMDTMALAMNQALVKGVMFCFDPAEGLPKRTLDRNQMQSVMLNLLINAIDATPVGGHINISTSLGVSAGTDGRKGIEVQVSDTGCGILPENLARIFDPFFTTKEVGKGTGLGLSVSLGFVEKHGGTISVRSRPGQGSTFIIWLPLEEQGDAA